ncbi:MAG: transporter [Burkholderiales bacterium]
MNTKLAAGLGLLCLSAAIDAQAAHPLITEDTGTQGTGRYQLEVFAEEFEPRATRRDIEVWRGVLGYGIAETTDVQVGVPLYRDGPDGVGDASLDLKWRFFERNAWSVALMPGITVPTGDERDGRGTGKATWGSLIILSYQPGAIGVHAHAGFRRNENKLGQRESLRQLAAAATYRIGNVRFVGELTRETNPEPSGGTVRYTTLGAIWHMARDLDLDIGWRNGNGNAPIDEALLLGATVRW